MGLSLASLQSRHLRAAPCGAAAAPGPPHGRSAGSGLAEERSVGAERASAWSAASGWGQGLVRPRILAGPGRDARPSGLLCKWRLRVDPGSWSSLALGGPASQGPSVQTPDQGPWSGAVILLEEVRVTDRVLGWQSRGRQRAWSGPHVRLTCPLLHLQRRLGCSGGCGPAHTSSHALSPAGPPTGAGL